MLDSVSVGFRTRLKLTGKKVLGTLSLPCDENVLSEFLEMNEGSYSKREAEIINKLNLEASNNQKLEIQISSNVE